jgi:hypothetical protein
MTVRTQHASDEKAINLALSCDYHNADFDNDEQHYLDRWLCQNIELDEGMREPRNMTEYKMLGMLRGTRPINMKGAETYIKWKVAREAATSNDNFLNEYPARAELPHSQNENIGSSFSEEANCHNEKNDRSFNAKRRFETTRDFLNGLRKRAEKVGERASDPILWASTALSTDFSKRFVEWTEWISQSAPTVYDKAVDAAYNATHEGGSALHRLVDGNHGVFEMWHVVKDALPNDSTLDEIGGYFSALWKDMATPQGIPLVSISRDNYDALADAITQTISVPRSWVSDALTVNGAELFASSFGVVALALNWSKDDRQKFAEIAATLGLSAAFSANPLMALICLVSLAKAFQQGRTKQVYTEVLNGFAKGGIGTGIFLAVSSVIGGPTWVGLVVGLCLAVFARSHLDKKITFSDLAEFCESTIRSAIQPRNKAQG